MVDVQRFERRAPVDLETASQIVDRHPEHQARIATADFADELAVFRPTRGIPTSNIARPQHQIGGIGCRHEPGQIAGVMRKIGIHLRNQLRVAGQCLLESRHICPPDSLFVRAGKKLDPSGKSLAQRSHNVGGAIR